MWPTASGGRIRGELRWINRKAEIEADETGHAAVFTGTVRDVTAQHQASGALAASEARFRTILDTVDAAFAIVEVAFDADDRPVDYRFVEANPAFERQAGVNLRGKWVTEFAPNLERFWFDTYGRVASTGEPANFENYAEAFKRWFDVRAVRVGDPAERRIAIFFSDVTARHDAEERLRASEAVARENIERVQLALAAGAIIGTWIWDLTADKFSVDEAFASAFGLDPALGREGIPLARIVETVHPDDKAGLARAIDEVIARGGAYAHQYRTRRADGRYYWLEANGHVNLAPDGTPLSFPGVLLDVEERRAIEGERDRAAAELRRLNESLEQQILERTAETRLYRDIVQSDPSPILAFDTAHRLIGFNSAHARECMRVIGHEQRVGDTLPDLFPPEQAEVLRGLMDRALGGETFTVCEAFGDPERDKPTWEITYTPLRDGSDRIVGAFHHARDVSARRRAEHELNTMQEQLRQSQKMEAVGQLTGGLAHDFNNLLAGISGALDLMNTRIGQGRLKDVDKYMVAAQGAAKRAAALTHRLLAFSRRQTLAPKPTNVAALVDGMLDLIQRTVGPSITIQTAGADLWSALVDPSQLENALLNLCINARDAMPDGGRITIEAANRAIDATAAKRQDMPAGQYLALCVTDTGTGMPPDVIAKAFDPFFTTKPIGQGTGLGLSMIYGFAKQSGGQVRIHSMVDQGTTVCIFLPRHLGEADAPVAAPRSSVGAFAHVGETVLVVDDEPTVRLLVTDVLEDLGYRVIEAADSAGGLRVLQSDARIDLLITDVGLPGGLNGRQMADAGRKSRTDLRILFITGYAENALFNNGQLDPGMAVLTKPFAVDALAARVRELVAR